MNRGNSKWWVPYVIVISALIAILSLSGLVALNIQPVVEPTGSPTEENWVIPNMRVIKYRVWAQVQGECENLCTTPTVLVSIQTVYPFTMNANGIKYPAVWKENQYQGQVTLTKEDWSTFTIKGRFDSCQIKLEWQNPGIKKNYQFDCY